MFLCSSDNNNSNLLPFQQDLLNVVRPTSLISPDQILDAIKAKSESRDMDLQYRGYLSM